MNEIKIGVYICHCGKNISDVIDVTALTEFSRTLENVTYNSSKPTSSNSGWIQPLTPLGLLYE